MANSASHFFPTNGLDQPGNPHLLRPLSRGSNPVGYAYSNGTPTPSAITSAFYAAQQQQDEQQQQYQQQQQRQLQHHVQQVQQQQINAYGQQGHLSSQYRPQGQSQSQSQGQSQAQFHQQQPQSFSQRRAQSRHFDSFDNPSYDTNLIVPGTWSINSSTGSAVNSPSLLPQSKPNSGVPSVNTSPVSGHLQPSPWTEYQQPQQQQQTSQNQQHSQVSQNQQSQQPYGPSSIQQSLRVSGYPNPGPTNRVFTPQPTKEEASNNLTSPRNSVMTNPNSNSSGFGSNVQKGLNSISSSPVLSTSSSSGVSGASNVDEELIPTAIVIKNIPFAIKKEQLLEVMTSLRLPLPYAFNYHFDNGVFRGLAFANFTTPEETGAVIQSLNAREIGGRKLRVEYKKMLPLVERERIEREKRERRGQLEEQHRSASNGLKFNNNSNNNSGNNNGNNNPNSNNGNNNNNHINTNASSSNNNTSSNSSVNNSNSNANIATSTPKLDLNNPETLDFYSQLLLFRDDKSRSELVYSNTMALHQRRIVMALSQQLGLGINVQENGAIVVVRQQQQQPVQQPLPSSQPQQQQYDCNGNNSHNNAPPHGFNLSGLSQTQSQLQPQPNYMYQQYKSNSSTNSNTSGNNKQNNKRNGNGNGNMRVNNNGYSQANYASEPMTPSNLLQHRANNNNNNSYYQPRGIIPTNNMESLETLAGNLRLSQDENTAPVPSMYISTDSSSINPATDTTTINNDGLMNPPSGSRAGGSTMTNANDNNDRIDANNDNDRNDASFDEKKTTDGNGDDDNFASS
ncbi:hypothetical protein NADFUDRAFT_47298 [Nadsonia fulvescens var. elongata DSM 6958]|uniref:RRM domain-containing protein n=1 Tax=Nadsonia fulvescens var. elongata DSM 6958 TaxID=857566 RepID=A0A1E3PHK6_9ASCO|nr:hypothetical protein NADFUDRAFT_47298 [Nadsonia fulvescens var. elongata DSM 6958]